MRQPTKVSVSEEVLIRRLRWASRRAWLELDILLQQFWQTYGNSLSKEDLTLLRQWLSLSDAELWKVIASPSLENKALSDKISGKAYA